MKPDVLEDDCEDEIEVPKKKLSKKSHNTSPKRVKKNTKNNTETNKSVNDDEPLQNVSVDDSGSEEIAVTKTSKTKGKKEKVGKMCQICGQIFKSLQAHLYVHDIYPPFECNICKKKFRHKANVLSHMKIHTNQR